MNNLIFSNNDNNRVSPPPPPPPNPKKKHKYDFKKIKNNTCNSLYEVEYFLNNLHRFKNYIKLYKILK